MLSQSDLAKLPEDVLRKIAPAIARLKALEQADACKNDLATFVKAAWEVIEPAQPLTWGWHLDVLCSALEAVSDGRITRLLINIPPGCMKSLLLNVFWPSWEWTTKPHLRFIATAHNQDLALRDSGKMRRLIQSEWYKNTFPGVQLMADQNAKGKFETTKFGFREAVAFTSLTGKRGDRILIDDPHSVDSAMSDLERQSTVTTFLEAIPTRLVNPDKSAIVIIMQRLHEGDVSGVALEKDLGYVHVCLPMEYDPSRHCEVPEIGFSDPRKEPGELLFPARFPKAVVERDKIAMGPYAVAGQFQQTPSPRGGGIIKRDWWRLYDESATAEFGAIYPSYPQMDYVLATLDTAYTEKEENDPSALCVFGVFHDVDGNPHIMLMDAWQRRLEIHGSNIERHPTETMNEWKTRTSDYWGLTEWVAYSCTRNNVDLLLIENKAAGISVGQELRRLHRFEGFGVRLVDPGRLDKVARAHSVVPFFAEGMIWSPDRKWADDVITQCENFPRAKNDDLVDCVTSGVKYLRDSNLLQRKTEIRQAFTESITFKPASPFPYEA